MGEGSVCERDFKNTLFDLVSSSHGPPGRMDDAHLEDNAENADSQQWA